MLVAIFVAPSPSAWVEDDDEVSTQEVSGSAPVDEPKKEKEH